MTNTYYIRTTDRTGLLALAVQIGLLRVTEAGDHVMVDPHAGIWDPVGTISRPTGAVISTDAGDVPEMVVLADGDGVPYWHANLMLYTQSLGDVARDAYQAHPTPELGAALQSIPDYFATDDDGAPVAPRHPARRFG